MALLDRNLIHRNVTFSDSDNALKMMAEAMVAQHFVKPSFVEAVINREHQFQQDFPPVALQWRYLMQIGQMFIKAPSRSQRLKTRLRLRIWAIQMKRSMYG